VQTPVTILYFVSYAFTTTTTSGSGNIDVRVEKPIRGMEDIHRIERAIRAAKPEMQSVVVNNWRRFEEEDRG
jgi:hypothetical protein